MTIATFPTIFCSLSLLTLGWSSASAQPAANSVIPEISGSLWIHDGDQLGQLHFSSPLQASFTLLPKLQIVDPSTGLNLTMGDSIGQPNYALTDIAWAADFSTMYGIVSRNAGVTVLNPLDGQNFTIPFLLQGVISFNPSTGIGTKIGADQNIGQVSTTIANAAGLIGQDLYSASDDQTTLYKVNIADGSFSTVGETVIGDVSFYSAGDIASYEGYAYSLNYTSLLAPSPVHLLRINPDNPSLSFDLGIVAGLSAGGVTGGFGLAGISGLGLYATGPGQTILQLNPGNLASSSLVTVTGDTSGLTAFGGMTSGFAVPEPQVFTVFAMAAALAMGRRHRRSPGTTPNA